MAGRTVEAAPRAWARVAGTLYLLTIVAGVFAQGFVTERLVVSGDAATTAANLLGQRSLVETGFAAYLIEMSCQIAKTALFYELLKPAGRSLALVAAFLGLAGCVIKMLARVFFIAPLFVLGGAPYLRVFTVEQRQALALLLLGVNDAGAGMALVFFGFHAILTGYLVTRSTFLPRVLGLLSLAGGVGWLSFLYPPLGYRVLPYVAAFALLGAAAMILWLLAVGVDEQRWREQARAAEARRLD